MTATDFIEKKNRGEPISMVTSYDSWSAALVAASDVDVILVGDSAAMVMHGHASTIPADLPMMAAHVAAVRRGADDAFVVADMPFLSFRGSIDAVIDAVGVLMQAGANAVKLEGAEGNLDTVARIVGSGVPVMGHLGLTPQSVNAFGGFRVQGRSNEAAARLARDAAALEEAGCFSVVLEAVPAATAETVSRSLTIPTIGIGAGCGTDGQVLVLQDLLGLQPEFKPRFVRRFLDGASLITDALNAYHQEVVSRRFPSDKEAYS